MAGDKLEAGLHRPLSAMLLGGRFVLCAAQKSSSVPQRTKAFHCWVHGDMPRVKFRIFAGNSVKSNARHASRNTWQFLSGKHCRKSTCSWPG